MYKKRKGAAERRRDSYLFPSPLERAVADGKPDRKRELERRCVSCCLIHPSLQAYGVPQGLLRSPRLFFSFPFSSPLFVNTEPNIQPSRSTVLWPRPCCCKQGLTKHLNAAQLHPLSREEQRDGVRHTIYHMKGDRYSRAQYSPADVDAIWTEIFLAHSFL